MSRDESFCLYILDQIDSPEVRHKRMFSGFGLYFGDKFFGIVNGDKLFLKTDVLSRKKFLDFGMKPFAPSEKHVLKNYFEVPEEIIEDRQKLSQWVLESLDTK